MKRLLIANRGEIACRIARTARRMGIATVAVYSDADAGARHVQAADAAVRIGPAPAAESYLSIDALLAAARASGADAVHPGYGFLSERASFARAVQQAGLCWVGPPPEAIEAMGDKAAAKRRMLAAGVPCVPGWMGEERDVTTITEAARALGLPLLIKARAGGGGRGMRLVREWTQWGVALTGAEREAEAAFGDGGVLLERLVEQGRHVEVQVFGDTHGQVVHLGERDCSAQRRRQKLIEESPAPGLTPALRQALWRDAVTAARAVDYVNAGTVEFIVTPDGEHFFLEMNTRLQVEHAVTEAVTGLDLVEWQLRVARGEPLPLPQEAIRFEGHAIEARLNAEDPFDPRHPWAPQTGTVLGFDAAAAEAMGARVDHGIGPGQAVTPHYDAMLAKFVVHAATRDEARVRLRRALVATPLFGLRGNARFLHDLLDDAAFVGARLGTADLDARLAGGGDPLFAPPTPPESAWAQAAAWFRGGDRGGSGDTGNRRLAPAWLDTGLVLCCGTLRRELPAGACDTPAAGPRAEPRWPQQATPAGALQIAVDGQLFEFAPPSPWPRRDARVDTRRLLSPATGTVAQLRVQPGDAVAAGQPLVSVEAMKMEMWVAAAAAGRVAAVHVQPRQAVAGGTLLIEIEPEAAP
jgi:geranyl-CoA carboxylase alpha subunit